jgi:hypothetical protein
VRASLGALTPTIPPGTGDGIDQKGEHSMRETAAKIDPRSTGATGGGRFLR